MASGRYATLATGLAQPISTVYNWNLDDTKASNPFVATNTALGTARAGGIRDWSGSYEGAGAQSPQMPNDIITTFTAYTAPDDGTATGTGPVYQGAIIIESTEMTWDWSSNDKIEWNCSFMGKPGLTISDAAPVPDDTLPTREIACGTFLAYWDGAAWQEVPALVDLTLNFSATLSEEANSGTRANNECWIDRTPGPIDWTLTATQQDFDRGVAGYPDLGSDNIFRLYTKGDSSAWYDLAFGRQEDYTGLVVDRNGDTIQRTLNIAMQTDGLHGDTPTQKAGYISLPASPTSPWWGTYFDPEVTA